MIPSVIESVVNNELCIGCGMCVTECPQNALQMEWNKFGLIEPQLIGDCDNLGRCLRVCPFNITPDEEVYNEDRIANIYNTSNTIENTVIGKYIKLYAGYSHKDRITSSSGGIATWILEKLLEENIVDNVIVVGQTGKDSNHFGYLKTKSVEELKCLSHTKYYPISLEKIFDEIKNSEGKLAITAIPCFLKAIRLKQYYDSDFKNKIAFTIGIICGGLKSIFFTEYLASKMNILPDEIESPEYRIKNIKSTAGDYSFRCKSNNELHTINMKKIGEMWGTGLFKPNACDYCDDLSAELADISVGDAWINPYIQDGRGTNIVISRTKISQELLFQGMKNNELNLDEISFNQVFSSQRGNYNHRRIGLKYRLYKANKEKKKVPPKRVIGSFLINPTFIVVQNQRNKVRKLSFELWGKYRNSKEFDYLMNKELNKLKRLTKVYHFTRYLIISNYKKYFI